MSLQDKYKSVLDLGTELGIKDGFVQEENGVLKMGGVAATQYQKDQIWDKIKSIGGENPGDLVADIKVSDTSYYTKHTVAKGESLSLIAKKYFKDPMKYKAIFEANTNILKDPDLIHPGQELVIPNL
ncbi:MAG: LysM peptidoglycan-binding domain-containing protein [Saprospiraceae bacterium]|nr:LysM peptidoglycan-binding domain-containing protein [Candidatus Vicinibacter affinis]MBP6172639.1 LysM peptidoglycan-binding domain-containing protein [Saprospiraceae bacterium]MBK6571075.1 LysM peptidoglycan-binding domain-containing protein [Candidatus Vicinibacter affinis]MBK6822714.1 LysM peptidoglycan-binding domain-containing protein [Candidatus Vicinibacter affinis]MBK7304811.1 LysM peptidoglycan-binding domain-containing protein [Candidatus Vicinibacter affinis]